MRTVHNLQASYACYGTAVLHIAWAIATIIQIISARLGSRIVTNGELC